ncbi:Uncharacterised protein [Neisseria meningitidis]|nr:Uncharacterised protein [Neisseria meningitidis]
MSDQIRLAAFKNAFLIFYFDIGNNPLRLNRTVVRRIIQCRCQLDRAAVGQRNQSLNRTFAEALRTDDDRAFVILQCTCDNLRRGSRTGINQHRHRNGFQLGRNARQRIAAHPVHIILRNGFQYHAVFAVASLGADDDCFRRQKRRRHADRAVQKPAGVVAQIQHQPLERFSFIFLYQLFCGGIDAFDRPLLELRHADIAVIGFDQVMADAFHFNNGTGQVDDYRLVGIFARQRQSNLRTRLAPHFLHRFADRHAACRNIIDFHNEIAAFHPRLFRRRVLNRRNHFDKSVFLPDFHPQAAKFAAGGLLYLGITFFIHIFGMRIQTGHHTLHRTFKQIGIGFVLIVVCLDLTVNLRHCADGLHRQDFVIPPVLLGGKTLHRQTDGHAADCTQSIKCDFLKNRFRHSSLTFSLDFQKPENTGTANFTEQRTISARFA